MKKASLNQVGIGEIFETLRVLGSHGVTPEDLKLIRSNPNLAEDITFLIHKARDPWLVKESESQRRARQIMNKNYIGINEACKHFKISLREHELKVLAKIPFSEDTMRECQDTHVLVADLGLSILEVRKRIKGKLFYSKEDAWCDDEQFASETSKPCWHLIRKDMVPNSAEKIWQEQCKLIPGEEEVPSACAMVYTIILNYLVTGERMFKDTYVQTSTVDLDGDLVAVGNFDLFGLCFHREWDGNHRVGLGIASSRK